jgi:signal peptidase I
MIEVRRLLRDYGLAISVAVAIAIIVRTFILGTYRVPNSVMSPTLLPGDTIFVAKWPFLSSSKSPQKGEVIVFQNPVEGGADFVRRVVALPGDRVAVEAGKLRVNGARLEFAAAGSIPPCVLERVGDKEVRACWESEHGAQLNELAVPEGAVFVIGDHRSALPGMSKKPIGELVPLKYVKGRVMFIWISVEPSRERSWFSRIRFDRIFQRV